MTPTWSDADAMAEQDKPASATSWVHRAEPTVKPDLMVDAEAIIERARVEISRLCAGRGGTTSAGLAGRNWTMCVPVQADDSDMVFSALLNLARHQRDRLASSADLHP